LSSANEQQQQQQQQPPPLPVAVRGVSEAAVPSEFALRCAGVVLDHPAADRSEVEAVLSKLGVWISSSVTPQVLAQFVAVGVPSAIVRSMRKLRGDPPAAALACVVLVRYFGSSHCEHNGGCGRGAMSQLQAGAIEEVIMLMDRHPSHGGIQNVCLLLFGVLLRDGSAARHAVNGGAVAKVIRAMEATAGREVQYNGLAALRLLTDTGRAARPGLQEVALRAKAAHEGDSGVCSAADEVLALVTPRFKEVMCWHWESGWCKLGPRCTYAHGPADLRGAT